MTTERCLYLLMFSLIQIILHPEILLHLVSSLRYFRDDYFNFWNVKCLDSRYQQQLFVRNFHPLGGGDKKKIECSMEWSVTKTSKTKT